MRSVCVCLLVFLSSAVDVTYTRAADPPRAAVRIAGYLPDYRVQDYDLSRAVGLTDLIVFSAEVTPEGSLDLGRLKDAPWEKLRQFKTQERIRLILCVGGWARSQGFAKASATPDGRAKFAREAVEFCLSQRLDGLDLDWEHPEGDEQQQGYAALLETLRDAFAPFGLQLSVTMAAWQQLPAEGFVAVDAIQIMAYDNPGQHSTLADAERDVKALITRGAAREKIVLGLPAYGRHQTRKDDAISYAEIAAKHKLTPGMDEVEGYYFNGPATFRKKLQLVRREKLAGVMVWELGQDADGEKSLMKVVREAAAK